MALNLSPETCLDPRLLGVLATSSIAVDRLVLELTENLPVAAYVDAGNDGPAARLSSSEKSTIWISGCTSNGQAAPR